MTRIDLLKKNYQRLCGMPWDRNVAGCAAGLARRLRQGRRAEAAAPAAGCSRRPRSTTGHKWTAIDLTDAFADWMCGPDNAAYAESYFESPDLLDDAVLADLKQSVVSRIRSVLAGLADPDNTVLALYGVASLFGFLRISEILPMVEEHVEGRLLVFFPGTYEQNNYRLLDARDGWNYHAVPITASDAEARS